PGAPGPVRGAHRLRAPTVPGLCPAVSHHGPGTGAGGPGPAAGTAAPPEPRRPGRGGPGPGGGGHGGPGRGAAQRPVGRAAAAGLHRPGPGGRRGGPAAGRAHGGHRRRRPGAVLRPAGPPPAGNGPDGDDGFPRPGRHHRARHPPGLPQPPAHLPGTGDRRGRRSPGPEPHFRRPAFDRPQPRGGVVTVDGLLQAAASLPGPLGLDFMQRAYLAGLVAGVAAPVIGTFLVLRRLSLLADGLGHAAFAGVAGALLLGASPVLGALAPAVLGYLAVERQRSAGRAPGDAAVAIYASLGLGAGLVLARLAGAGNIDLFGYLFGSLVTVRPGDAALLAAMGALVVAGVAAFYKELL